MNKTVRRALTGATTAIALLCTIAIQPAQAAYTPPVVGTSIMRMTAPLPGPTNSVNLTPDAKGKWDQFYGKGLNARVLYADVRSTVLLTFKYTNAAGLPYTNRTVYLIVNKKSSCSKTTFSTTSQQITQAVTDLTRALSLETGVEISPSQVLVRLLFKRQQTLLVKLPST